MNKTYNKFNLDVARADYGKPNYRFGCTYLPWPGKSLAYSHAYVVSNEDLRHTTGLTCDFGRKVLTVAGSGEQPLFYTLHGAEKVDTFDISFCAKAIMDIKTTAIRTGMPYEQYVNMLSELQRAPSASQVAGMHEIMSQIPSDSANFVRGMDGYRIFGNGLNPETYAREMISESEYAKLQSQVNNSFKFIWSDVACLHTHLLDEYDVINLSNIFEWSPQLIVPTLSSLRNYVRPGGYILAQTGCSLAIGCNIDAYIVAQEKFKRWAKMGINKQNRNNNVIVLERIR